MSDDDKALDLAELRRVAEAATEGRNGAGGCGHVDAGDWRDRSICPEPCGSMHFYCEDCGVRQDFCALATEPAGVVPFDPPTVLALLDRLEAAEADAEAGANTARLACELLEAETKRAEAAEAKVARFEALTEAIDADPDGRYDTSYGAAGMLRAVEDIRAALRGDA